MNIWFALLIAAACAGGFTGVFKPSFTLGDDFWNTSASVRLMEKWNPGFARIEGAWTLSPSAGDPAIPGPAEGYSEYRIADFDARLYPNEFDSDTKFTILHNLDRLSFQVRPGDFRITVGRQAIFWGLSKIVSPTDFIAPVPYGVIDSEYRVGVDAVRAVHPTGMLSEMEAGVVFGEDGEDNGYWTRGRFYVLNTDLAILGADFHGITLAGGSLNRAIGGATGWIEGAYSHHDTTSSWWNLSTGVERSFFQSRLVGFLEYHHNSAGVSDAAEYPENSSTPAYTSGTVYLMARSYCALGLNLTVSPLLNVGLAGLGNLDDKSIRASCQGDYSLGDNTFITVSLSKGFEGGSGDDEFGSLPFEFSTILAYYFQ